MPLYLRLMSLTGTTIEKLNTASAIIYKKNLVGIDSRMPNYIFESSLRTSLLKEFSQWTITRKDFHYGDSRIDYLLEKTDIDSSFSKDNNKMLLEVKSCSLVIHNVALFPDVPTIRGLRQIRTLMMPLDVASHLVFCG
jgi:sugar fermentation stimulation protein A